ncbi:MAG: ABC transporter ATP-binding protein [Verrucomicrobiota bacterium]
MSIQLQQVSKFFKVPFRKERVQALQNVSLEVSEGEVYGLIGPNGSGKSTTMKIILGLIKPSLGSCTLFGQDSQEVSSKQDLGFLPENPYFYKHLTGAETLRFHGKLCGLSGRKLEERIEELLVLVGMERGRDRRLAGYSKGMLQRIGLAQALVHRPRVLLLDEPTAGVDPSGSRIIRDLILDLKKTGITILLSSHLLEQVQEVCDRVGIIFQGQLVKEGPLEELIAIETQSEVILEHASPALLSQIADLVQQDGQAQLLRSGHPKTTLERLFLKETTPASSVALAERPALPSED